MFSVWTIYYVRSRLHRGLLSNRILFLVISYSVYAFFACHLHQTQDWSCFKSWARESGGAISEVWPPIECCVWSIEMSNIPHTSSWVCLLSKGGATRNQSVYITSQQCPANSRDMPPIALWGHTRVYWIFLGWFFWLSVGFYNLWKTLLLKSPSVIDYFFGLWLVPLLVVWGKNPLITHD